VFKKGDAVRALILAIDREQERFSLGIKQLEEDPWTVAVSRYPVGETAVGKVTNITDFGLFVELDESKVNGLVHVTQLPHDYYHFDPIRKTLTGERRGMEFRLGDRVRVLVLKASLEERKIDFRLVEKPGMGNGE
jgi:ribonuclease R